MLEFSNQNLMQVSAGGAEHTLKMSCIVGCGCDPAEQ